MVIIPPAMAQSTSIVAWGDNSVGQTNVPSNATNVVAIAAGYSFNLALRADGQVVAWGDNSYGQTNVPPSATNVVAIAASLGQCLALRADGTVVGWGGSVYGGNNVPAGMTNVVAIAEGNYHGAALRADNTVVTWGYATYGSLNIPPSSATNVVAIAAGAAITLGLRNDGSVAAWGNGYYGELNVPSSATNLVAIGAGFSYAVGLRADGNVIVWGGNYYPEILNIPADATNVVAIAAGYDHILALRADGKIISWGDNSFVPDGITNVVALSAGSSHNITLNAAPGPVIVKQPLSQTNYINGISVFSVAVLGAWPLTYQWQSNGTNLVPSDRFSGVNSSALLISRLATNDTANYSVIISNPSGSITSSVAGLTVTGTLPSFSSEPSSQIISAGDSVTFSAAATGDPLPTYQWRLNGTNLTGKTNASFSIGDVQAANAGDYTVMASNIVGQTPSQVATLTVQDRAPVISQQPVTQAEMLAVRTVFTAAVKGTEPLSYQWQHNGTNLSGVQSNVLVLKSVQWSDAGTYLLTISDSVGNASAEADLVIVPIAAWGTNFFGVTNLPLSLTNVVAIAAGCTNNSATGFSSPSDYNLALLADGSIVAWGNNAFGQTNVPTIATNAVAVAAGCGHCLALLADGGVVAWGNNFSGQTNVPPSITNAVMVAAGSSNSLALLADGSVVAWGNNANGQSRAPSGATNVVAIAGGGSHCLALRANGTVIGWGNNLNGQTNTPAAATNCVAIAAGGSHSLALRADGSVVGWGNNSYGQATVPAAATNVVAIAAGGYYSLALRTDGNIVAWGSSAYMSLVPTVATNVVAISTSGDHSLALILPKTYRSLPSPQLGGNSVIISLATMRGGRYVVERANSLSGNPWSAWQRIAGDGAVRQFSDPIPGSAQGFYRAWLLP